MYQSETEPSSSAGLWRCFQKTANPAGFVCFTSANAAGCCPSSPQPFLWTVPFCGWPWMKGDAEDNAKGRLTLSCAGGWGTWSGDDFGVYKIEFRAFIQMGLQSSGKSAEERWGYDKSSRIVFPLLMSKRYLEALWTEVIKWNILVSNITMYFFCCSNAVSSIVVDVSLIVVASLID